MKIKFGNLIKQYRRFSNPLLKISELSKIFYFNFIDYSLQTCPIYNKTFNVVSKLGSLNSLRIVLLPILFLNFISSFGQVTQTFTSSGTFTVPANVYILKVEVWGGGGAGGGSNINKQAGGGGGGGAYTFNNSISVTPGEVISYTVGAGGVGVVAGNGSNGGSSTFKGVNAGGGFGGLRATTVPGAGGTGGTGGFNGGSGRVGTSSTGGGGGSSAGPGISGTGSVGISATSNTGATAPSGGGNGGDGSSSSSGNNGLNPGGGGGGSADAPGSNQFAGGNGGIGQIKITYTQPILTTVPTSINFGYVINGGTSTVSSFSLSGTNLLWAPGNITINAPANFEVSLAAGSGFSGSVNVPYSGITLAATTIYTRFKPSSTNTDYVGNITINGGGTTANVGVSGTSKLLYCASSGNMSYQTSITRVQFNTINNSSAKPSGYSDYTTQSTNVNINNTYNLSVNVNTDGNYTIYVYAWIDWNHNGVFEAGESYNLGTANNTPSGPTNLSPLNITSPAGATLGSTRMRIAAKYNVAPTACEPTIFDGEVEDYTLNILQSCTIPTISSITPASRCGTGTVVLGATASAGIINWYAASTGGTSLGTGTSFTTPSITTTTTYWVDATDSGCTTGSRTAVIATVNQTPATPEIISGVTTPCENITGEIYSITAVPNATSYTWTVPLGWTITSGNGTTSITLTTGTAGQNGNISVTANNTCGSSTAQTLAVTVKSCINKWKGSISNDWNTPANWSLNIVPAVDANILFDDAPLNHLVLDQDRTVTDVTNTQATYRMVLNGRKLTLKGALIFSNGAQIDAASANSIVEFAGSAIQSIPVGSFLNDAIYNITVSNSNNVQLIGNLRLLNLISTPSTGRLDAITNNSTINYAGNSIQSIISNQYTGEQVYNLTIDNAIGVNLNTNFNITNNLLIHVGKKLTIYSQNQLTVLGSIINNGGINGFILHSDVNGTASLLHSTNSVPATVQRYISRNAEDWHFLSSPVTNQPINGTWLPSGTYGNGTGYDLYVWNEPTFCWIYKSDTTNWNITHPALNFVTGKGYLYSVQATKPTKSFEGNLNNGALNIPISKSTTADATLQELEGYNLVGNPYPSSVDWSAVSGWSRTNLISSAGGYDMWVWNPETNNYGVYNSATLLGTNGISRYLAPMQGFFVRATSNGNLGIDNSVRTHTGAGNWFRTTNTNTGLIRITVQSETTKGADEALLQFGYPSNQWGASKIFSHITSAPSLYMNASKKDYSVQYLTNTTDNKIVPVAFKAGADGYYTLKFDFDTSEFDFVMLEDRLTKSKQLITANETYLFKATVKDTDKRFVLHFASEDEVTEKLPVKIYSNGTQLLVDLSMLKNPSEIAVYDILGKLLLKKSLTGATLHNLNINVATQILMIHLQNEEGSIKRKLFFHSIK